MKFDPTNHHRRSIRLQYYDYTKSGAYFVTVCTRNRECLFGEIVDGIMRFNNFGIIVTRSWKEIPMHFDNVTLDAYMVMPNHVHGIIVLMDMPATKNVGAGLPRPYKFTLERSTLGKVVAYFKYQSTKYINEIRDTPGLSVWQRNYYDHIVRNESDWGQICEYIENNPARWSEDENHPANIGIL